MKSKFRWYFEISDPGMNETLAREVFHVENSFGTHMCADGEEHRLCECDKMLMEMIKRKAAQDNLTIFIWKRIGNGRIVRHHGKPSKTICGVRFVKKLAREARKRAKCMPHAA